MKLHKIILGSIVVGLFCSTAYADDKGKGHGKGHAHLEKRIEALESLVIQLQSQINDSNTVIAENAADISTNSDSIAANDDVLQYASVVDGELNGVVGPHFIFNGVNVHVQSGAGSTAEECTGQDFDCLNRTGLGNLIIGYNESREPWIDAVGGGTYVYDQTGGAYATTVELCSPSGQPEFRDEDGFPLCDRREGSHGLIVGRWNNNMGHANVVAGLANDVGGHFVSITGGQQNSATANYSVVSGGLLNRAYGFASSVSGGFYNKAGLGIDSASGRFASVSGGTFNVADGEKSSVSGGQDNFAGAFASSVSGGINSLALGFVSSVSGGDSHVARGAGSSISGGQTKTANADFCTVGDNGIDC
jgi:hypothetical protein